MSEEQQAPASDTAGLGATSPDMGVDSADDNSSDVNWGGMADELIADDNAVEGDEQVVEPSEGVEEPSAPVKPAEVPAVPPVSPPSGEPVVPPAAPTPPPPLPETPVPSASPEDYASWKTKREGELQASLYALSDEDAAALITEPEKVLPKLAAKMHMEVLENAMRAMQAMVPVMMEQVTKNTEVNTRAKNLFTSINPDLADARYESAIMQLGQTFRKVNPTADAETAARAIGALVRSALNIPAPQVGSVQQPAGVTPTPAPFTPARGGGGQARTMAPSNPFSMLAEEFLNDDM